MKAITLSAAGHSMAPVQLAEGCPLTQIKEFIIKAATSNSVPPPGWPSSLDITVSYTEGADGRPESEGISRSFTARCAHRNLTGESSEFRAGLYAGSILNSLRSASRKAFSAC